MTKITSDIKYITKAKEVKIPKEKPKQKDKWISTGGYRGYKQKAYSIAGSSDTGMAYDSPAPSDRVQKELRALQKHLKGKGINTTIKTTQSSNVFMGKRWIVTSPSDYKRAKPIAEKWLDDNEKNTEHIHETD